MGGEPTGTTRTESVGSPPAKPRTEAPTSEDLDDVLARLIDRAHDEGPARLRLQGLLVAVRSVVEDLSRDAVLHRVVELACEMVSAPYGALGVLCADGRALEDFITVGVDATVLKAVGRMPEAKGLLGALVEDPRPIRLSRLEDDVRSVGLPKGHPSMEGFLGVPIRVGDVVFGNLYLASPTRGSFTADDEDLMVALAAAAGVAIEVARSYEDCRRRQQWLVASNEVTRKLLTSPGEAALHKVAESVAELARADLVTVATPVPGSSELEVQVAVGHSAGRLRGTTYPRAGTYSDEVLTTGVPIVIADASSVPDETGRPLLLQRVALFGPVMALPLAGTQEVRGVVLVGRLQGGRAFSPEDLDMATTFTQHASLALELGDARRAAQRIALVEDGDRVARDLHHRIVTRLFDCGMVLQGVVGELGDARVTERVEGVIDALDETILQVRRAVFEVRPHSDLLDGAGLRAAVVEVVGAAHARLRMHPRLRFRGPVDRVRDAGLAHDVAEVIGLALAVLARGEGVTCVDVEVTVDEGESLTVVVEDDGSPPGSEGRDRRLDVLRHLTAPGQASLELTSSERGDGARVSWRWPLTVQGVTR